MDEFLSPHARTVLLGDRRCTATNRDGTRCGRASALGQFVCDKHGAKTPASLQAGRERLLMLAEPALDALLRALKTGPPCEHCGRSDADRDPVVVRAAQIVLDRAGFGPSATMHVEPIEPVTEVRRTIVRVSAEQQQHAVAGYLIPEDGEAPEPEAVRAIPVGEPREGEMELAIEPANPLEDKDHE